MAGHGMPGLLSWKGAREPPFVKAKHTQKATPCNQPCKKTSNLRTNTKAHVVLKSARRMEGKQRSAFTITATADHSHPPFTLTITLE